jgi:hypothetical protein
LPFCGERKTFQRKFLEEVGKVASALAARTGGVNARDDTVWQRLRSATKMNTGIDCKKNMLIAVRSEYKTSVCNGGQGKITLNCGDIY